MKKFLIAIILVVSYLTPTAIFSQEDFLRVTAQGNRSLSVAIMPPQPLSGPADVSVATDIADIFKFDLGITGLFSLTDNPAADMLLKTAYSLTATTITLEYRFYDSTTGKEVLAKRYSAARQDLRKTAHTFVDELLFVLTGERGPFTGKIAYISTATGNKEIYLMDWDGFNVRKLTGNGSINLNPEFSPSGRELIYTSYRGGNPDLYRRELFTGTEARISTAPGINITGSFAPDGNRIALAMSKDGNSEIYLINKEGKQLARLTRNQAIDLSPAWSPDGRFIVFVSDRHGKPQLFVMRDDGSEQKKISGGGYNVSPRWSPRGDRIVYCRQYGNSFQIHAVNPDGNEDRQLTFNGSNEHPRWSPDGRLIVFSSKRDGSEQIYVMRADGSGQTRISRGKGKESHPTWSARW